MRIVYGVDVGGSGIKGAPVDVDTGLLIQPRNRHATPQPSTPQAVYDTISDVVTESMGADGWDGPMGVAIPAVVVHGVSKTAANIDRGWVDEDARSALTARFNRPVIVLNDADAAGFAEMRFGAGRGVDGVVVVLTFGTGVGSAVFSDGSLVPNTELGHLEFENEVAEARAAARLVERDEVDLHEWVKIVDRYLIYVNRLFSPQRIIFGGGISKRFEEFGSSFTLDCDVVPAELRNNAGIVGAAVAAARS